MGHFGNVSTDGIVDLGFVIKSAACVQGKVEEAEAQRAAEEAANQEAEGEEEEGSGQVDDTEDKDETFASNKAVTFESNEDGDEDGDSSDVVVWVVVIVIVAVVLAIIIIILVHCCTKNKSTKITKVGDMGAEMKAGPATANNSSSIPQESEEDGKMSAKNKESDRQYFGTDGV